MVRRNIVELPEPSGSRKGTTGKGPPLKVLILGDSAAAGVGVDHQDSALSGQLLNHLNPDFQVSWQLEAFTGASTKCILQHIMEMGNQQFDILLTSLGVNDVTANVTIPKWLSLQKSLHEKCFEQFQCQFIIASALPPVAKFPALPQPLRWYLGRRAKQFNRELQKLTSKHKHVHYLDIGDMEDLGVMAADGFHPGEQVYQQWAFKAAEKIKSDFKPKS